MNANPIATRNSWWPMAQISNLLVSRLRLPALGGALILLVAVLRTHFLLSLVVGNSMLPTFEPGDLLVVDKRAYRCTEPKRGDLVVARHRNDVIVKRVVGLSEEEIEIAEGGLVVNGNAMPEAYVVRKGMLFVGKGRVSEGKFAMIGDNRALSGGAIVSAIVPKEQIIGKVVFSVRLAPRRNSGEADGNHTSNTTAPGRSLVKAPRVVYPWSEAGAGAGAGNNPAARRKKLRTFFCHSFEFGGRRVTDVRYEYPS